MISIETARSMAQDQAAKAAQDGNVPFMVWQDDLDHLNVAKVCMAMPYLGTHLPDNWERVKLDENTPGVNMGDNDDFGAFFVDSSGFAGLGEAALTPEAFIEHLEAGFGYAIVEAGQFQVKIGKFKQNRMPREEGIGMNPAWATA